ncbi:fibrinogen like 1B [Gadus morhua]|uniref:fibrinogen like 1B n=1 Tax=Gadus morhua TaxID=8049 RepID=UPI0011B4E32A|nr:fibrinogen-like protein 1 [Gadus morhua]
MLLLLLLSLVSPSLTSTPQFPLRECWSQMDALRVSVRELENKVLIGSWQIDHLKRHKYIRPFRQALSGLDQRSNGTEQANPHRGPPNPLLPPAGSVLVHDKDCSELFDRLRPPSGFYRIRPKLDQEPFLAYCDMEDGGGWTVLQRRRHGRVDFDRDWVDYRDGFGDFKRWNDEFWLGNEHIHVVLSGGQNLLKIDLTDWSGQTNHAFYQNFRIANEEDSYRLQYGQYSGRAGDALTAGGVMEQWSACVNGMQFTTRDQDNDRFLQGNCAKENMGGWWFNRCHTANLNGRFYRGGEYKGTNDNGVVWGTWRGLWYSLRHTAMKVRPLAFLDSGGSGDG